MQTFSRFLKKFFRLRRKFRKTGYYWVQFTYAGVRKWRIGWYNEMLEHWEIDGTERRFHDNHFIKINERRIPQNWIVGNPSRYWLYILLAFFIITLLGCIIDIYNLIIHIVR